MTLTPKEEAVLNLIEEDLTYENYFFKKVSDIKWFYPLKGKGFFDAQKAPSPKPADQEGYFIIPEWNVLLYLERISQKINIPGNEKYIDELLAIIKKVSNYRDSTGQHIDNYRTWFYFVKILCNIPNDKIPIDIIDLIPIWLDSKFDTTLQGAEIATRLLPKFLTDNPEDIKKAERIIDSITTIKTYPPEEGAKIHGKAGGRRLVIDSYWLEESFKKYSEMIGEKCTSKVVEDLTKKIKGLLRNEDEGTYYSFYEEREYSITEPLEMLTFILKRILLAKAKSDVLTAKIILKQFIQDKYLYFPKMALYVMGQNMEKYSDLFWEILKSEKGDLLMQKTLHFGDELKHLLENLRKLSDEQRKILNQKIENAAKKYDFKEDPERYIALSKQQIYKALSHDQYFKNLYDEMKRITKVDAELHPAVGKVETRWGPGPSPLTKEEIIKMSNDELAEYFLNFKTTDFWSGPTVEGLADLIAEVAKEMPEKFIENLSPFKDTGFIYIYEILKGIRDAWKEKKVIDWNKLFEFIEQYINRKKFWEDKFIVEKNERMGGANHNWVVGMVAELIQDGTRDDAWAFPEQHFKKAEEIIFLLFENLKAEEDKEIIDYVTYTLNTPFGKTITAFILLALRIARVNNKKGIKSDIKWPSEFKGKYEELLNNKIIEGYTCLGMYLPNLYYLDKKWAEDKIKALESDKSSKYWEAFIDGYLSIGRVYDEIYNLMRAHYQYALSYEFKEKRNRKHLIQHICIAYLREREKLDDPAGLFWKLVDEWRPDQIREVIGFFWMQRGYLAEISEENEKIKGKIIEFWRLLYDKYKVREDTLLTKEDKQILSSASRLAVFLPQINTESYKWLMLSASYVHEGSSFFIKYLDELKDKGDSKETAGYIGKIFLKMLEKFIPDFDQKHIRSIVEFLYDTGETDNARLICNTYGSSGYEFLRDIYEKHSNRI